MFTRLEQSHVANCRIHHEQPDSLLKALNILHVALEQQQNPPEPRADVCSLGALLRRQQKQTGSSCHHVGFNTDDMSHHSLRSSQHQETHPKNSWSSNSQLIDAASNSRACHPGKDPDAGKDWRQEEKVMTEDEMVGWHHWLNGHECEQAPRDGEWQGSLACCSPWGCRVKHDCELNNNHTGRCMAEGAWIYPVPHAFSLLPLGPTLTQSHTELPLGLVALADTAVLGTDWIARKEFWRQSCCFWEKQANQRAWLAFPSVSMTSSFWAERVWIPLTAVDALAGGLKPTVPPNGKSFRLLLPPAACWRPPEAWPGFVPSTFTRRQQGLCSAWHSHPTLLKPHQGAAKWSMGEGGGIGSCGWLEHESPLPSRTFPPTGCKCLQYYSKAFVSWSGRRDSKMELHVGSCIGGSKMELQCGFMHWWQASYTTQELVFAESWPCTQFLLNPGSPMKLPMRF